MSVFMVETYVIKSEKREEFMPALQRFLKYKEENPEIFKGVKSWKLFQQEYGAISELYIEMWEFDSIADIEKVMTKIFQEEEMKKISQKFHTLIEPATYSTNLWSTVV